MKTFHLHTHLNYQDISSIENDSLMLQCSWGRKEGGCVLGSNMGKRKHTSVAPDGDYEE